jgi:hypothetical protein
MAPGREVVGGRPRTTAELQEPPPLRRLQKNAFGFVRMREYHAGEHARAVVRFLIAIGTEYVVIGAILVVMLEKVAHPRGPLDELALLEIIQLAADPACVLRMRDDRNAIQEPLLHHGRSLSQLRLKP